MTDEIEKHLKAVERTINEAKALLSRHEYPDNLRTVMVAGFIDIMVEHHEAILLLIRAGKVGSAFALARSVFEAMFRAMWVNFCATDNEIENFEKRDEIPLTLAQLADAVDKEYRAGGLFADLKKRAWPALNSYAHSGMLQLGRRFTGRQLKPAYSGAEIYEVTTSITTSVLVSVSKFLAVQRFDEDARAIEKLIESYGPAAERGKPSIGGN